MSVGQYIGMVMMFGIWGAISAAIALGYAEAPPFWGVFSTLVLMVFARTWGIKLARQMGQENGN